MTAGKITYRTVDRRDGVEWLLNDPAIRVIRRYAVAKFRGGVQVDGDTGLAFGDEYDDLQAVAAVVERLNAEELKRGVKK